MAPEPYAVLPAERRWLPIFEYLLRVYRRTWRASAFGRILSPVLMLLSLGFGLGSLVDRGAGISGTGRSCRTCSSSPPRSSRARP